MLFIKLQLFIDTRFNYIEFVGECIKLINFICKTSVSIIFPYIFHIGVDKYSFKSIIDT